MRWRTRWLLDTGPGNMVIDALAARVTNGALRYDDGGKLARQGQVSAELLRYLVDSDDYLRLALRQDYRP